MIHGQVNYHGAEIGRISSYLGTTEGIVRGPIEVGGVPYNLSIALRPATDQHNDVSSPELPSISYMT